MALYREGYIFRIDTPEPALFWSGHTDLLVPADSVLPTVSIAIGGGELVSAPDLEMLLNGVAQRADFVLSGVSEQTIAFAQEEAPGVLGAAVNIGTIPMDADWQQAGPVQWEWSGEARGLSVGSQNTDTGRARSITLTVASGDTTRSRAPIAFFTDSDQRRRLGSEDDAIFDHVAGISGGTSRRWGPA